MSWDAVLGQERVKNVLRTGLATGRVPHAYLFFGPYGVGKRAVALTFAKALQCDSGGPDPCDNCANCSRIDRLIHPDVRFFLASPKETAAKDIAERVEAVAANPYDTVDFVRRPSKKSGTKQAFYPIQFIHGDIKSIVDYKSFEGRYKVIIISDADTIPERTGNAFLKILEEPAEKTVFILISDRPDRLLPTILSRCQPVRFDPLNAEVIEDGLVQREGLDRETAGPLALLADGSYSTALGLIHDEQSRAFRTSILPFLRMVYANETLGVLKMVEDISSDSLDHVKLFLSLLLGWVRDLILVRELGPAAPIVNVDVRDNIVSFCNNLEHARLGQMVDLIEEALTLISRNVRVALVLTSLAAGLRRSMLGKTALPLTTPLADQLVSDFG